MVTAKFHNVPMWTDWNLCVSEDKLPVPNVTYMIVVNETTRLSLKVTDACFRSVYKHYMTRLMQNQDYKYKMRSLLCMTKYS